MSTATTRKERQAKLPADLARKLKEGTDTEDSLFAQFKLCGGDWARVDKVEEQLKLKESEDVDGWGWRNASQIDDMCKCPVVGKAMRDKAAETPANVKPHPDIPDCEPAMQYWVRILTDAYSRKKDVHKDITRITARVDEESARDMIDPNWSPGGCVPCVDAERARKQHEKAKRDHAKKIKLEEARAKKEEFMQTPQGKATVLKNRLQKKVNECKDASAVNKKKPHTNRVARGVQHSLRHA